MVRRALLGAAALAIGVGVAGCGQPINPEPIDTTKAKPTPKAKLTASPHPTSTKGPEVEAVRRYNQLFNEAFTKLDPAPLLAAADTHCTSCQGTADVVRKLKANGGHYDGFRQRILEIGLAPDSSPPVVEAVVGLDAFQIVSRAGAKPKAQKARRLFLTFEMKKRGDTWMVAQITQS